MRNIINDSISRIPASVSLTKLNVCKRTSRFNNIKQKPPQLLELYHNISVITYTEKSHKKGVH